MKNGLFQSTNNNNNNNNTLNKEWGLGSLPPGGNPTLIAAGAEALYPSLDPNICAKVVRKEVLNSDMQVDNCNLQEMARYLAMTSDPFEHKQWKVD